MSEKQLAAQLAALQKSLTSADIEQSGSLADVFSAFLDLAEGVDLMHHSKRAKNAVVWATLERLTRQVVDDEKLTLGPMQMLGYAPAAFLHGGFFVAGAMGTYFYFTRAEQGLVAFNRGGGMTQLCRITSTALPPGTVLMRRPPGKQ